MRKTTITVAALAATLILAGFTANATAMPADTSAEAPAADLIVAATTAPKVTLTFQNPDQTVEAGTDVTLSVDATNTTGNKNPDVQVLLSGCGPDAAADPDFFSNIFSAGDTVTLSFTVTGLTTSGTCSVTVQSNHGGAQFDSSGSDTVTITVTGGATTTTTIVDEATTTTEAESGTPVTGSSSAALAVMALGLMLVGGATIAATRRRLSA